MTTRGWRLLAAAGTAAVVVFALLPARLAAGWYHLVAFTLIAVLGRHLWRSRQHAEQVWWVLAGAVSVLAVSGLLSELPDGRLVADVQAGLLALGYVLAVLASGRFIAIRTNLRDLDGIIDSLILCCALGVVLWEFIAGPRLPGIPIGTHAGVVAFPFLQALVVSLAVRFMFWGTWRLVSAWLVFAATVACSAANVGYVASSFGIYRGIPHTWVGALWLLSIVFVVLGGAHPSRPVVTQVALPGLSRVPYARLVIMALSLVAAPVVVFLHAQDGRIGLVPAVGSLVLMLMVVARLLRLVIEREKARSLLALRSEQQAYVVQLGQRALAGCELARLFDEAATMVAASLRVGYCAVFEPFGTETLAARTGVGWRAAGSERLTVTTAEPFFGVPLVAGTPGYFDNNLGAAGRQSPLLRDWSVVAGVSVPVGTPAHRFGVLAVASRVPRRFSADDVSFLRAVANVLAGAVERSRTDDETRHATLHDALTGLPNRLLLMDRMESALSRAHRLGRRVAVMVVDLDGFKAVNDTFGHRAGDQLLVAVARRLQKALRGEDTLSRLSGDEFVVVCERIEDLATVSMIADRIVTTLAQPFVLDDGTVSLTGSVGIAMGAGLGEDADQLVRDADLAMYSAKQHGRARYEFSPDDWTRAQLSA